MSATGSRPDGRAGSRAVEHVAVADRPCDRAGNTANSRAGGAAAHRPLAAPMRRPGLLRKAYAIVDILTGNGVTRLLVFRVGVEHRALRGATGEGGHDNDRRQPGCGRA
ncbi:hypothetical protein D3C83_42080 [compost metagenome]